MTMYGLNCNEKELEIIETALQREYNISSRSYEYEEIILNLLLRILTVRKK